MILGNITSPTNNTVLVMSDISLTAKGEFNDSVTIDANLKSVNMFSGPISSFDYTVLYETIPKYFWYPLAGLYFYFIKAIQSSCCIHLINKNFSYLSVCKKYYDLSHILYKFYYFLSISGRSNHFVIIDTRKFLFYDSP